jgi:alkylation response protein AidB-like acyl-CoA dehydrogenase
MSETSASAEQAEFREYCRRWLEENRPPPPPSPLPQAAYEVTYHDHRDYLVEWQANCYAAQLIGTDVAREYGGHGHTNLQAVASAEVRRANVPYFINWIGLGMAAPTLLVHGTEEQKKRFLPKIFTAEEIWCQGFSEPGAGSDLVSLKTSAVRDGDNWIINGSKVWTSLGALASWMILLARTDRDDKYNGITYFLAPMDQAGVTVRPIHKMTGETGFNEVFLENVVIPDHLRVDKVGAGWQVAMSTLTSERGAAAGVRRARAHRACEEDEAQWPPGVGRPGHARAHREAVRAHGGEHPERPPRAREGTEWRRHAHPAAGQGHGQRDRPGTRAGRARGARHALVAVHR